jgi:hypothetical protein
LITVVGVRNTGSRRDRSKRDAHAVLGVPVDADAATIAAARKRLAKRLHPDAGGSVEQMQELNEAAERALHALEPAREGRRRPEPQPAPTPQRRRSSTGGSYQDHPSFTIEALPAEAFEGLLIAAALLGDVVDDEPPYMLEVIVGDPTLAWCRLELTPEAGASTVSLTLSRVPDGGRPDLDAVRDRWIEALNRLDWDQLDRPPPW